MDNEKLTLFTVYNNEGKRIELSITHNAEDAFSSGKDSAKFFSKEGEAPCTFKVWEATEIKQEEKKTV